MSYFPAYIKLNNQKILIIGAGKIAHEKLKHLLDFTDSITVLGAVATKEIKSTVHTYNLELIEKSYEKNDMDGYDIVIVAIDDINKQKEIYLEAKEKKILCNTVDVTEFCDFIFPSYIKKGDLTISVSTSGASPAVAKYLRKYIENLLPKNIDIFLKEMRDLRKKLPKGKNRMKFFDTKAKDFFDKGIKNE